MPRIAANGCDFNWSMQHLTPNMREEDVAYEEVSTEDLLHRSGQDIDVGALADEIRQELAEYLEQHGISLDLSDDSVH